jgi:hypothetical protein
VALASGSGGNMNDGHTNVLSHSNLNVPDAIVNVRFDTEADVSHDGANHELRTLPASF